jgi:phosphohistidine phosphatase
VRVYVVRHAEAAPGDPDELRRLTPAGRAQARALGERLAREGVQLDALLTSPLLRARETGAAVAKALGVVSQTDERLAPGATPDGVRAAVAGRGRTVAIVGHQPDCGEVVAAFTGAPPPPFNPASVHVIDLAGR